MTPLCACGSACVFSWQDELTHILRQQLDLKCEAYNLWKFTCNFRNELKAGLINFPQVRLSLDVDLEA